MCEAQQTNQNKTVDRDPWEAYNTAWIASNGVDKVSWSHIGFGLHSPAKPENIMIQYGCRMCQRAIVQMAACKPETRDAVERIPSPLNNV